MKAMLLAAGAGTRLRPLTDTVPKPLAPIANMPLIERTLAWLKTQSVEEVVINLHHHATLIQDAIGDGERLGLTVRYSVEEELLGTSGAVQRCAEMFAGEPFFVVYGDNLIDADLRRLLAFHQQSEADATIALFTPDDPSSCGMVELSAVDRVLRFVEKPRRGETDATMANAGIYVIEPDLLPTLPTGFSDFGKDIFPQWLAEGRRIYAAPLGGYLQDTGTPERYRKANWDVLFGALHYEPRGRRVGDSIFGEGSVIDPGAMLNGRNIVGEGCTIEPGAILRDCILWPGATVSAGAVLENVIVGQGARVLAGTQARGEILV